MKSFKLTEHLSWVPVLNCMSTALASPAQSPRKNSCPDFLSVNISKRKVSSYRAISKCLDLKNPKELEKKRKEHDDQPTVLPSLR